MFILCSLCVWKSLCIKNFECVFFEEERIERNSVLKLKYAFLDKLLMSLYVN